MEPCSIIRIIPGQERYLVPVVAGMVEPSGAGPSQAHLQRLIADDRCYLLAAVAGETVIGYALAYRFPSLYADAWLGYLYDIEVAEAYRRKGVGTLLIEKVKVLARADGVDELWLGTGTDNEAGQALYAATGAVRGEETFNDFTYYLKEGL